MSAGAAATPAAAPSPLFPFSVNNPLASEAWTCTLLWLDVAFALVRTRSFG